MPFRHEKYRDDQPWSLFTPSYSWDVPSSPKLPEEVVERIRSSGAGAGMLAPDSVQRAVKLMGGSGSRATLGGRWISSAIHGPGPSGKGALGGAVHKLRLGKETALVFKEKLTGTLGFLPRAPVSVGHAAAGLGMNSDSLPLEGSGPGGESFSAVFPPPYRLLLLVSLGILCWALNMHGLRALGLDPYPIVSPPGGGYDVLPRSNGRARSHSNSSSHSSSPTLVSGSPPGFRDGGSSGRAKAGTLRERPVYHLAFLCAAWAAAGWYAFRAYAAGAWIGKGTEMTRGDPSGRHAQAMQAIAVLGFLVALCWPGDLLYRSTRKAFGRQILRILTPSLKQRITFADVLLADVLTSFAKVLGDVWLTACFLMPRSDHHVWWNGRGSWMVPMLASLPYLIRFRQCLSEYYTSDLVEADSHGMLHASRSRSKRPLANAVKYATALPVIWFSSLQGSTVGTESTPEGIPGVYNLWLLSVMVNSLFSFWWDVTNDWGLELLKPATWAAAPTLVANGVRSLHKRGLSSQPVGGWNLARGGGAASSAASSSAAAAPAAKSVNGHLSPLLETPGGGEASSSTTLLSSGGTSGPRQVQHRRDPSGFLRPPTTRMLFSPGVYQSAVALDLVLRFLWSLKLSSHLHHVTELEAGVFLLEALEIIRRWAWVYLRIEWEAVKKGAWEHQAVGLAQMR